MLKVSMSFLYKQMVQLVFGHQTNLKDIDEGLRDRRNKDMWVLCPWDCAEKVLCSTAVTYAN